MDTTIPLCDMPERWSDVFDFPGYSVSDRGRVLNTKTGNYVSINSNSRGIAIVGLTKDAAQYKRSLSVLVATAFVPRDPREGFDTPINLDGNRMNSHYANLLWRPLWFARKYHHQFMNDRPYFNDPIIDVEAGLVYDNSRHASVINGVLDSEIYISMVNNTYVWPTGQIFREYLEKQLP